MTLNSLPLFGVITTRKISAIFFLSIFNMFLLHQVLPHVHHEHDGFEDAIIKVEDHHHGHENDHHHDEKQSDDFDFLGFLLGNHSHSIDVNTLPTVKNIVTQKVTTKCFSPGSIPVLQTHVSSHEDEKKYALGHAPPDISKSIYLHSSSRRGPPSLG
ncbi:MAG: hypothetical protein ACI8QD_001780 [Cyclobacteriaceae bacterium]|jgi:hypothetical protein